MDQLKRKLLLSPDFIKIPIEFVWGMLPDSLRFGKEYKTRCEFLSRSQWWTEEEHERYQFEKLKDLLGYAYKNVPFYKNSFDKVRFKINDFNSLEDMQKVPFTDKLIVNKAGSQMISRLWLGKNIELRTTGGSSGVQTKFYCESFSYAKNELPYVNSIWGRVGYVRGKSRIARFRNDVFPDGKLWRYDYKRRELLFDSYHLTDENIRLILDKIVSWKAEYLHTYPSNALVLCDYIKRKKLVFKSSLRAVLVTSENLYVGQKEEITDCLGARCFTFYGHSEGAGIAGWCECMDKYHINTEYGYMELIDEDGKVINKSGQIGEIVCTGFNNMAAPFIRYKTGDYAKYSESQTCMCGRHYKLLDNIEGRWNQEFFLGKDGNRISMAAVNMHNDIFNHVRNYQFIQEEKGKCFIQIVKGDTYTKEDEIKILQALKAKIGDSLSVDVIYADSIERTVQGKQLFIVNKLKNRSLK